MKTVAVFTLLWMLVLSGLSLGQVQPKSQNLIVNGRSGQAPVAQISGHAFVDLSALTQIGQGSVQFQPNGIVVNLPAGPSGSSAASTAPPAPETRSQSSLSREFMKSGIESLARMREWATTLASAIQGGYNVTDSWVADYRDQAANSLSSASASASTDADHQALQLLTNGFNEVRDWSDKLLEAKKRMDVGKYATSPGALREDPASQKIIKCGHFLAAMLGSGEFQDDGSCR